MMKNFAGKGKKMAATVLLAVMAMGYSADASAEKITRFEFVNSQGEQKQELFPEMGQFASGSDVNFIYAENVEKLKITSKGDDLKMGVSSMGTPLAGSIGIFSKNANIDFTVKGEFNIESLAYLNDRYLDDSNIVVFATGIRGTDGGSTNINADDVSISAVALNENENNVTDFLSAASVDLNQHDMQIKSAGGVQLEAKVYTRTGENGSEILSLNKSGANQVMAAGIGLNKANAVIEAEDSVYISATVSKYGASIAALAEEDDEEIEERLVGSVTGVSARRSAFDVATQGSIYIFSQAKDFAGDNSVTGVFAYDSTVNMQAAGNIAISALNWKGSDKCVYSVLANDKSQVKLTSGEGSIFLGGNVSIDKSALELKAPHSIVINGNVDVVNGSLLKLSGRTQIKKGSEARSASFMSASGSNVNIDNSTLIVDGGTQIYGDATLNNAKLSFYDEQAQLNDDFHGLDIKGTLNVVGQNELFLRADSSKASDVDAEDYNSDVIRSSSMTGNGNFNVTILDEGMKNGYINQNTFNKITIFADKGNNNFINEINAASYDNGIWKYAYDMDMQADANGNIVINGINSITMQASSSQLTLQSANKAAVVSAVAVLGMDNALHEHLCEVHEGGAHEEVWAKYLGGKVKADGAQVKYNGVELGYDAYVGNDWTFGVGGMQVRGNTKLADGNGKVKTNVGMLYGQWHGDGGEYVNLEAKAGRVSSENKILARIGSEVTGFASQKVDSEFSAPAYSLSAEYGNKIVLADDWFVEPTAKLSYVHLGASDYNVKLADTTAHIANDSFNSFALRGGAKLGKNFGERGSFYVKAAAVYDFGGDVVTTVSADNKSARYEDSIGGWGVEYGAGVDYHLSKASKLTLDVERRSGGDLKRDWGVNVGVSYSF